MRFLGRIFFLSFFLVTGVIGSDDPFEPGSKPASITVASWERLIVFPDLYKGKVIHLGGWLHLGKDGKALLFKDKESFMLNKNLSYIDFGKESNLFKMMKQDEKISGLNGKYVIVISEHQTANIEGEVGLGYFTNSLILRLVEDGIEKESLKLEGQKWAKR